MKTQRTKNSKAYHNQSELKIKNANIEKVEMHKYLGIRIEQILDNTMELRTRTCHKKCLVSVSDVTKECDAFL